MKPAIRTITIKADKRGHYLAAGTINGHPVTFLIDTGATNVAIPEKIAQQIGLKYETRARAKTAGGIMDIWLTSLKTVKVGGLGYNNLQASINPSLEGEVLLGMSFLKHFRLKQKNNYLIIEKNQRQDLFEHVLSHGILSLLSVASTGFLVSQLRHTWPGLNTQLVNASMWLATNTGLTIRPDTWKQSFTALILGLLWGAAFWLIIFRPDIEEQEK